MPGSVSSELSTKSKSESKQDCPYCAKAFQMKSLFHHIRIHHPSQFLENTQKKWIEEAETGKPLKMIWESNIDEELGHSDMTVIYGCLATDKCFTTEERGMRHFKHNPAELKKHNTQLRKLKKEFIVKKKKDKEASLANPVDFSFQKALRENNPKLIEGLWKGMLNWKNGCDLAISLGHYYFKEDFQYATEFAYPTPVYSSWPEVVTSYEKLCHKAHMALQENNQKASYLHHLYVLFWDFLFRWKKNIILVTELDPRLDDTSSQSIVVQREERFLDEEYFYLATTQMKMPTPDDFLPPVSSVPVVVEESESESEPEVELPVNLPGATKAETQRIVKAYPPGSTSWNKAFTCVLSGKLTLPPEAKVIQQAYPKIIQSTKRPPTQ